MHVTKGSCRNTHGKSALSWNLLYVLVIPAFASAQPISLSPDITLQLGSEIVADEGMAVDDQAGGIVSADVGSLGGVDFADLTIQKQTFFSPPGPSSQAL